MREHIINEWFQAWLEPQWDAFEDVFDQRIYYCESWGPEYLGVGEVRQWFNEWHKKSQLIYWRIKKIIHDGEHSIVEWVFCCKEKGENIEFEGVSIITWNDDTNEKILTLKEYSSTLPHYRALGKTKSVAS